MKSDSRGKVVTFRLSEGEYASLKLACGTDNCTISTAARRTVMAWAESQSTQPRVDQRLAEIDDRLETLYRLLVERHGS